MTDLGNKICRYFNTSTGCWYGHGCKFLHVVDERPPCKFYKLPNGCRFGEYCHFSHEKVKFKSTENSNNLPVEDLVPEMSKENVDPNKIGGTNNNNLTQSTSLNYAQNADQNESLGTNGDKATMGTTTESDNTHSVMNDDLFNMKLKNLNRKKPKPTSQLVSVECESALLLKNDKIIIGDNKLSSKSIIPNGRYNNGGLSDSFTKSLSLEQLHASSNNNNNNKNNNTTTNNEKMSVPYEDNFSTMNEVEIYCGSCQQCVEQCRPDESYCTILKNHYLKCFMDKDGDHVKHVKLKANLELGQLYWCKSCILLFEKPWSLFQHMADKVKSTNVPRWEKKVHLDWMDNVAALMAGYDLGLFAMPKLKNDLYNLLTECPHVMEEDFDATAALTTAAMLQLLISPINPHISWRMQQRDLLKKIEHFNRQLYPKPNPYWMYASMMNRLPFDNRKFDIGHNDYKYKPTVNQSLVSPQSLFNKKEVNKINLFEMPTSNLKSADDSITDNGKHEEDLVNEENNAAKAKFPTDMVSSSGDNSALQDNNANEELNTNNTNSYKLINDNSSEFGDYRRNDEVTLDRHYLQPKFSHNKFNVKQPSWKVDYVKSFSEPWKLKKSKFNFDLSHEINKLHRFYTNPNISSFNMTNNPLFYPTNGLFRQNKLFHLHRSKPTNQLRSSGFQTDDFYQSKMENGETLDLSNPDMSQIVD